VLGFLIFNFHPARIFMGDTGSMFLGFTLAVVTVATSHKGRVAVAMLTPILALGLPILDTLLAIARRAWFGQSLFVGDRQHIHHRLLASGLSHRKTVLVMYGFAALFAMLGLGVQFNRDGESALLFLLSLLVAGVLLRKVGYLAMPQAFGVEIGHAQVIRERNRLIREAIPLLSERLKTATRIEEIAAGAATLCWTTGACTATLQVQLDDPCIADRRWTWDDVPHDSHVVSHQFAIRTSDGSVLGRLDVSWTHDAFHDAVLPSIDVGCRTLADQMAQTLKNTPAPHVSVQAGGTHP
jgi:UDP-GlcNAc:undecaprenyl-phosphate GlcNAc-1-phosphate transferase